MIKSELSESPVTEAVRSLEVRWIFPGRLEAAVAGWFGRFPARTESREDAYLLDPTLPGLSVKIRGGGALEIKAYRGSPGILQVAGRASRFSSDSRQIAASAAGPRPKPLCEVELTAVRTRGRDWWTLGFEATGPLKAQAANAGHPLGAAIQTNDLWVATTAIYHDAPLLTANRRHFENFPGLSLPA